MELSQRALTVLLVKTDYMTSLFLFVQRSLKFSLFYDKVVPREWLMENNARLLILSGNNICFTFMASKAVNGRAVELARLVVFLALVSTPSGAGSARLSPCSRIYSLRLENCFPTDSYQPGVSPARGSVLFHLLVPVQHRFHKVVNLSLGRGTTKTLRSSSVNMPARTTCVSS